MTASARLSSPITKLALLMIIAYLLRLALIASGGQLYHADEHRYFRSLHTAEHLFDGEFGRAVNRLLGYGHHQGIAAAKLLPAMLHTFVYRLGHDDSLTWSNLWSTPAQAFWIPALLFALPSVLSIGLAYAIQRQAGGDEIESLLGAFLMAASNALFIYSQHLIPYDIAILVALLAIYYALRNRNARLVNAVRIGFLAFLVFWIYNGYVFLTVTIGLLYCLFLARDLQDIIHRGIGMALGASLIFVPILVYNAVFTDTNVLMRMYDFSNSISQGSYAEGLTFPFLYLRDVEGAMCVLWLAGLGLAARRIWRQPASRPGFRGLLWLGCILSALLLMIALSAGLRQFVLYGRVVRILVPFIAMACAFGIAPLLSKRGLVTKIGFVAVVALLSLSNAIPAMRQQYPLHIAWQVYQDYDNVSFETTVQERFRRWNLRPEAPDARYRLYNSAVYLTISEIESGRPEGRLLLEAPHPLHYRPWQYEGLTAEMRDLVNSHEFKIWLIDARPDEE